MEDRFACEYCGLVFPKEAEYNEHVVKCTKTVIKVSDTSVRDEEVCLEYDIYIEDNQTHLPLTQTEVSPVKETLFDCTTIKIVKVETVKNAEEREQNEMVLTTLQPVQETEYFIMEKDLQQLEVNKSSPDGIEIELQSEPQNLNTKTCNSTKDPILTEHKKLNVKMYSPRKNRASRKNGRTNRNKSLLTNQSTEKANATQSVCPIIEVEEPNANSPKLYRKLPSPIKSDTDNSEKSVYDFYDEEYEKDQLQKLIKEKALRDIKARTCRYCKKIFNDPIDVLRHKREFHKTKKIELSLNELTPFLQEKNRTHCPLCLREICPNGYKSLYIKHIMTHCSTKDLSCQVCGTKFKRKDYLEAHEKRHVVRPETT